MEQQWQPVATTTAQLLVKIQSEVHQQTQLLTNRNSSKPSSNNKSNDSSLNDLTGLESIRWFALDSDSTNPSTSNNSGPINPILFRQFLSDLSTGLTNGTCDAINSSCELNASHDAKPVATNTSGDQPQPQPLGVNSFTTAYSEKRSTELQARVGDATTNPKYVQLGLAAQVASRVSTANATPSSSSTPAKGSTDNASSDVNNAVSLPDSNGSNNNSSEGHMPFKYSRRNYNSSKPVDAAVAGGIVTGTSSSPDSSTLHTSLGDYYPACLPSAITGKMITPNKKLMKLVGQAMMEWSMIQEGDRLLLGLSGGKDSLCLLHILLAVQKRAPVKFEIACATVDPQTSSFDPAPLIPYVQSLGVPYHFLSQPIIELAKEKLQGDSLCAFCSRFKRGFLYSCCRYSLCVKF